MPPESKKLLDQVRETIRMKHYSRKTEKTYVSWIRRFILFHGKKHPQEMGEREIEAFLSHLAVNRNVAASTQNQAFMPFSFSTVQFSGKNWRIPSMPFGRKDPDVCLRS